MENLEVVRKIMEELDASPVECDGFVRLAATVLNSLGIEHTCVVGSLSGPDGNIPMHFWIEMEGGIIDYRARMWLGKEAPHGIFSESGQFHYSGKVCQISPLPPVVFEVLSGLPMEHFERMAKI